MTEKTQSDTECLYGIMNIEAALSAARNLSDRAYKLYVRMMLHQDKYKYALSPVEINHAIGMSDKRYREGVKELIKKGYLVQSTEHKNLYTIYEYPQKDSPAYPKQADRQANLDRHSCENGQIPRPYGIDAPPVSGGEILQDITPNTTPNNTSHSTVTNTDDMRENNYEHRGIQSIIDETCDDISYSADELPRWPYADDGELPF